MQIHPDGFTRLFLTVLGLGMLVFAVVLNHYHPRNAGVATSTHGSINVLALDVRQFVPPTNSALVSEVIRSVKAAPQTGSGSFSSVGNNQPDQAVVTEAAANPTATLEDRCHKLDDLYLKQVKKMYDQSYQIYLSNKQLAQNSYGQPADSNSKTQNYYQLYLNTLDSLYSSYKLQLVNQGCPPLQPPPIAQPR